MSVSNERVQMFEPMVRALARKYVGRNGAEYDDLVQEGLIDVWLTLRAGKFPSPKYIQMRMSRYCTFLAKHQHLSYDETVGLNV